MKLVYAGERFYSESRTMMSSIYTKDGKRCDWSQVQHALLYGEDVEIRQATAMEKSYFESELAKLKKRLDG